VSLLVRDVTCREAVELVTNYLEGQLPRRQRRGLEQHLAACKDCAAYLAQVRAVLDATGRAGPEDLDEATLDGLLDLYRRTKGETP
jgi:anti-sigma factor RsiW